VTEPRALLGAAAEQRVVDHLERSGFRILARNFRTRLGEIDIIASRGRALHFVEVRARTSARFLHPAESVDARKQRRIRLAAEQFLCDLRGPAPAEIFFDVACVIGEELDYRRGAFE
jgi:putative endonuclease